MNVSYNKLSLDFYNHEIGKLLKNDELRKLGFTRKVLGYTTYGYPIDFLSIGYGMHDLFVVGCTHSSEIITADYILQLIKNIPFISSFDPNLFTIKIIPIQNPEGFDICTSAFSGIESVDFESKSKEYFLRYRTDSLIYKAICDFNKLFDEKSSTSFLSELKYLINNNQNWKNLSDKRAMPKIVIFNDIINSLEDTNDFVFLFTFLSSVCLTVIDKLDKNSLHDSFLCYFMSILNNSFTSCSKVFLPKYEKLHQMMFKDIFVSNLRSTSLEKKINIVYSMFDNPNGSIVTHDSTGQFINLNANNKFNPGISIIKNHEIKFGPGPKSNVRNYYPGPLGIPCLDVNNFDYSIENKILYSSLKSSYNQGRYLATLLYHGTGGLIYYKPYSELMDECHYLEYLNYNNDLTDAYNLGISSFNGSNAGYRKLEDNSYSGYGDLLRRTFPGVILIELSRMGGNPIAPYGDISNINNTFSENFLGFNELLNYLKCKINNKKYIKK